MGQNKNHKVAGVNLQCLVKRRNDRVRNSILHKKTAESCDAVLFFFFFLESLDLRATSKLTKTRAAQARLATIRSLNVRVNPVAVFFFFFLS